VSGEPNQLLINFVKTYNQLINFVKTYNQHLINFKKTCKKLLINFVNQLDEKTKQLFKQLLIIEKRHLYKVDLTSSVRQLISGFSFVGISRTEWPILKKRDTHFSLVGDEVGSSLGYFLRSGGKHAAQK